MSHVTAVILKNDELFLQVLFFLTVINWVFMLSEMTGKDKEKKWQIQMIASFIIVSPLPLPFVKQLKKISQC